MQRTLVICMAQETNSETNEIISQKMKQELINEIIAYIEEVEEKKENEWGYFRELSDLIEKKEMPDVYYKLVQMRELQKD